MWRTVEDFHGADRAAGRQKDTMEETKGEAYTKMDEQKDAEVH